MLQNQRPASSFVPKPAVSRWHLPWRGVPRTAGPLCRRGAGSREASALFRPAAGDLCRRAPGICPKPVCDAGEPCLLPPQDDAVDVSVIVPVHNGERFLRACLDSILHQNTTRRLQVLAVEDGSTDGSGAILAEYAGREGSPCCTRSRAAARPAPATPVWPGRWAAGSCLWIAMTACCRTQWRRCWRRRRVPGRISCRAAGSIATKPTPAVRCSSTQKRAAPAPAAGCGGAARHSLGQAVPPDPV